MKNFIVLFSILIFIAGGFVPLEGQQEEAPSPQLSASMNQTEGSPAVRIRDIASFEGVRENQLVGFGLVTGLKGQGDSTRSALVKKMMANFLHSFGVGIPEEDLQSKNSAAVVVTATVPPFVRKGRRLDVDVSSLLDAQNIGGGILMQTNLKAANGTIYAVAQGRVISIERESPKTVGRVLSGAIVERDVISEFGTGEGGLSVLLDSPDFSMALQLREVIEEHFPDYEVRAVDAEKIELFPGKASETKQGESPGMVELSARIGSLEVTPDYPARVVINRYSGVVVMGKNVRVAPVVISFRESELSIGRPGINGENRSSVQFDQTAEVGNVVSVLKDAGLKVEDIIEVLQTLERAGALYGRLEVM